ncbi:hypothetical protein FNV43_RR06624 [Rhamnella rubrinervis]|uniref:Uncharacterized protein n=1 Tax=Rhamnella rubrinervis TaxID=2594499 RepID=A0A8K0HEX1_9ROSA|nr:hypothetical protein FNV43_RR06624 [Rhamnella rubrinervis]
MIACPFEPLKSSGRSLPLGPGEGHTRLKMRACYYRQQQWSVVPTTRRARSSTSPVSNVPVGKALEDMLTFMKAGTFIPTEICKEIRGEGMVDQLNEYASSSSRCFQLDLLAFFLLFRILFLHAHLFHFQASLPTDPRYGCAQINRDDRENLRQKMQSKLNSAINHESLNLLVDRARKDLGPSQMSPMEKRFEHTLTISPPQ